MSTVNPLVKCSVDQCTHWMPGDQCMAAKIAIYNGEQGVRSETPADTQCKSFHAGKGAGDYMGALHNANLGGAVKAAFAEGTQITPSVECYVDNCRYWETGNYCNASGIEVSGPHAAKTVDTDCKTFAPQ